MLTNAEKSHLESVALDTLTTAYKSEKITPPIDVQKIAVCLGLNLSVGNFAQDGVIGAYSKTEKKIYLCSAENYGGRAFATAHAIGHYILHTQMDNDVIMRSEQVDPATQGTKTDLQARYFAAALLMPEFLVKQFWMQFRTSKELAHFFKLANSIVTWRLQELNLFN